MSETETDENAKKPVSKTAKAAPKKKAVKKAAPKKAAAPKPEPAAEPDPVLDDDTVAAIEESPEPRTKQDADRERRDDLIEQGQELAPKPTPEEIAEHKRREAIADELQEIEDEIQRHNDAIDALKQRSSKLLLDLYPTSGPSDPLTTAVRGYLKAASHDRAARVSQPARLAKLLEQARLAPIDAAMRRPTQRGTKRPTRPLSKG